MPLVVASRRRDQVAEAVGALDLIVSNDDFAALERAVPKGAAVGSRHPASAIADLYSEKR